MLKEVLRGFSHPALVFSFIVINILSFGIVFFVLRRALKHRGKDSSDKQ